MKDNIKLCPYITRTIKETINEGLKVSEQQFMPCVTSNRVAYDEIKQCCMRTCTPVHK